MNLWREFDRRARRMGILDTKLAQGAAIFLALAAVKVFPVLLALDTWVYAAAAAACAVRPVVVFFGRARPGAVAIVALLALGAAAGAPVAEDVVQTGTGPDAEEMVLIPAGEFVMGADEDSTDHGPAHRVVLSGYYIDRHEVTNARYAEFCEATGRALPMFWGMDAFRSGPAFPDHPVVGVSWNDAVAYARWRGKRLPSEAEWERAARGGREGAAFAHGDTLTPEDANHARSAHGGPVAVGSYPANGYGLFDMTGNVCEWVADRYAADSYATGGGRDPAGPAHGRFRVIRGGGWHSGPSCCQVHYRNALPSNWLDFNVGFRCAKDGE